MGMSRPPFLENVFAGDEAGAPFEFVGAVFFAVGLDIFLGNAIDDGSDFGPDAGTGPHGARFVGGVQDEVRGGTGHSRGRRISIVSDSTCLMGGPEVFTQIAGGRR